MHRPTAILAQSFVRVLVRVLVPALVLVLAACASGPSRNSGAPPSEAPAPIEEYLIGVDDIVQVTVWRNPDLGITVPVRPDGMISVPLVGDVRAGGLPPGAVAEDIREKLSVYVRDPQVAVILTDLRSHEYLSRVRVTGAVRQPISIPYRQGMTVLDAVLAAGGVTEFAAPARSELYRSANGGTRSYSVRLNNILDDGDLTTNFKVAPGDVITVPERAL